jgi:hypothetical protein
MEPRSWEYHIDGSDGVAEGYGWIELIGMSDDTAGCETDEGAIAEMGVGDMEIEERCDFLLQTRAKSLVTSNSQVAGLAETFASIATIRKRMCGSIFSIRGRTGSCLCVFLVA